MFPRWTLGKPTLLIPAPISPLAPLLAPPLLKVLTNKQSEGIKAEK